MIASGSAFDAQSYFVPPVSRAGREGASARLLQKWGVPWRTRR